MTYDPNKIEDWSVCSSGFWRKGTVREDAHIRPFRGTWEQAKNRSEAMAAMDMRHMEERAELAKKQAQEREAFYNS